MRTETKPTAAARTVTLGDKEYPYPVIGQDVYVRTSWYISHGRDDFDGGLCRIDGIIDTIDEPGAKLAINRLQVTIEERPGWQYNWFTLWDEQNQLRERYGERRGCCNPDYHPSANDDSL